MLAIHQDRRWFMGILHHKGHARPRARQLGAPPAQRRRHTKPTALEWLPRPTEVQPWAYTSGTSGLSHDDLEDIVVNLRKQSMDDDQASVSGESGYYESDDADQVLSLGDHILPVAEPYWCADNEFINLHDDELLGKDEWWLSAVSWAIVADRGETELPLLFKPSSVSTLVLPSQFGDDSISWYSALRECWTDANLLPVQEELAYDSKLLPS